MKLTGPALVMRGILLAILFGPVLVTSIVTSYEKLRMLVARGDDVLIQGIEETITEGQERIKNLTAILTQYYSIPKTDYQFQADHPNAFYLLVKHHVTNWFGSNIDKDYFPVLEDVIKEQNVTFPTLNEFPDAVLALIRLQYVYKLKARDMFEGNYLGYMGPRLEKDDAYLIGKQAFMAGYLPEAKEWLQFSVELMAQDMENFDPDSPDNKGMTLKFLREDYFLSLTLLGRTLVYLNESETARKIYEECTASENVVKTVGDVEELGKELDVNLTKLLKDYEPITKEDDENITILCSREKHQRVSVIRPHHVCRYKSDRFLPYRRFAEEILSTSPYASVFYDVIHESEIEKLKDIAIKDLRRGRTVGDGSGEVSDSRTGDLGWVDDEADPLVAQVSSRVKAFTGLDVKTREKKRQSSEPMQVVNYGLGGHYDVHMDPFLEGGIQNRLATVLFYLTDVEKGGATIFPRIGVSVSPVKGMALAWYNYEPHMKDSDELTHHAGCPVLMGNKWIANKWIWTYGNTFRRPCGPSPQSTQLEVENIASFGALKEVIQ
uniref:procollagen-proline 4-dioxygenase n=1 Tax=Conus araneosus TaxID=101286 RepID=A0A346CNW7_CONAO|nr:prolyl 4-hydroxylase [Conus araneosus]